MYSYLFLTGWRRYRTAFNSVLCCSGHFSRPIYPERGAVEHGEAHGGEEEEYQDPSRQVCIGVKKEGNSLKGQSYKMDQAFIHMMHRSRPYKEPGLVFKFFRRSSF